MSAAGEGLREKSLEEAIGWAPLLGTEVPDCSTERLGLATLPLLWARAVRERGQEGVEGPSGWERDHVQRAVSLALQMGHHTPAATNEYGRTVMAGFRIGESSESSWIRVSYVLPESRADDPCRESQEQRVERLHVMTGMLARELRRRGWKVRPHGTTGHSPYLLVAAAW